jgi:hypothetical protein
MLLLATSYRVVFDITKDARPDNITQGRLVVLLVLVAGALLFVFRCQLPSVLRAVFPTLFVALGLLGVVALIFRNVPQPSELAAAYRAGKCEVIEGVVTQFHPMPATGHDVESFVVAGKHFRYSDYIHRAGFNQTSSHGGPIHEGARVRIEYLGEDIAKLEIDDTPGI